VQEGLGPWFGPFSVVAACCRRAAGVGTVLRTWNLRPTCGNAQRSNEIVAGQEDVERRVSAGRQPGQMLWVPNETPNPFGRGATAEVPTRGLAGSNSAVASDQRFQAVGSAG
jgi:hypothetical protein